MTTIDTTRRTRRPGFHPVNIGHLVMGIALLGIAVLWALVSADVVTGADVRWLLPVPWVLAGAVGLVASTRRGVRSDTREDWALREGPGWLGTDQPVPPAPYDDLEEKLARAEAERHERLAAEKSATTEATTTSADSPADSLADPTPTEEDPR